MSLSNRIKRSLRGGVSFNSLVSEGFRRFVAAIHERRERSVIDDLNILPARLRADFAKLRDDELLNHFRTRTAPAFFPENLETFVQTPAEIPGNPVASLLSDAKTIVDGKSWPLMGFGLMDFSAESVWRRDPLSGTDWGLDYHRDVEMSRTDGSDIRVLWEMNRLGHLLTLARAYAVTRDEIFAAGYVSQIRAWRRANPYGRGANWTCAMEVALRAVNILASFELFRQSERLNEEVLAEFLQILDQHGRFIEENSEFSYIRTSNHYLTNVAGLLWTGILLPELEKSAEWREKYFRELLREMDKQVLDDGANFESSTGYHRFVTELFLYSFLLCRRNGLEIPGRYLEKLRLMVEYVRRYLRPDGFAPLIGDSDGGQFLPIVPRRADDHAFLLGVAAVFFDDPTFKSAGPPEEILWLAGASAIDTFRDMPAPKIPDSLAFPATGAFILRKGDLYLFFNVQDCGLNGRGSHAHNDKLSVEISAFGSPFVVDAGTYAYGFDLAARHRFRSTAAHSTVEIDEAEQNSIEENVPFVIGNESRPVLVKWKSEADADFVSAEHFGYERLADPVVHRRSVTFDKTLEYWIIDDEFQGSGNHRLSFRFHLAQEVRSDIVGDNVSVFDAVGNSLRFIFFGPDAKPEIAPSWISRHYGSKAESKSLRWSVETRLPFRARFAIIPLRRDESPDKVEKILGNIGSKN